jgi:hypothetical protein
MSPFAMDKKAAPGGGMPNMVSTHQLQMVPQTAILQRTCVKLG